MPRRTRTRNDIVNFLLSNPQASRKEIAYALGLQPGTVQKHVWMLTKEGIVRSALTVSEEWREHRLRFWVFIKTKYPQGAYGRRGAKQRTGTDDYQERLCQRIWEFTTAGSEFKGRVAIDDLSIMMGGPSDVMLSVLCNDQDALDDFVTKFLRIQPEIESTTTAWRRKTNFRGQQASCAKPIEPQEEADPHGEHVNPRSQRRGRPAARGQRWAGV